jgi:Flp pilus assembly protein protease CpaA
MVEVAASRGQCVIAGGDSDGCDPKSLIPTASRPIISTMSAVLFFIAGLPAAYALNRAISDLSRRDEAEEDGGADSEYGGSPEVKTLPWQTGLWPARLRIGIAALAPFFMAAAGWRFSPGAAVLVSLFLLAMLLCTATDLLRYRVPNLVTYPGTAIAFAAALVLPGGDPLSALIAALIGSGVFLLMAILTRGGLGLGDVKLAALIGAALGFPAGYQALFIGVFAGGITIAGLFMTGVVTRRQAVPYAPFLALSAAVAILVQGAAFAPL